MAIAAGISEASVRRIWHAHGMKPHLSKTFKLSRDPEFTEKLEDIVGPYLNPPEHAIVLCADEKSQIQALDRTQPGLPMKKGRCGTMTHDYKRNGLAGGLPMPSHVTRSLSPTIPPLPALITNSLSLTSSKSALTMPPRNASTRKTLPCQNERPYLGISHTRPTSNTTATTTQLCTEPNRRIQSLLIRLPPGPV
jgi:hypothetical protein